MCPPKVPKQTMPAVPDASSVIPPPPPPPEETAGTFQSADSAKAANTSSTVAANRRGTSSLRIDLNTAGGASNSLNIPQ